MNHSTVTLVTDNHPRVHRSVPGPTVIRFGADDTFTVILAPSMTPDQKAAWLLGFAKELTDLAADIQSKTATVTAKTDPSRCPSCGHMAHKLGCLNMASDNECACPGAVPA